MEEKNLTSRAQGAMGEVRVEQYLLGLGWEILERNYACTGAEIDLIARDGRVLVFVEVKVRNRSRMAAREAVTPVKQKRLSRGALYYMMKKGLMNCQARFDVVEIQDGHLTHLRDAFPYQGRPF